MRVLCKECRGELDLTVQTKIVKINHYKYEAQVLQCNNCGKQTILSIQPKDLEAVLLRLRKIQEPQAKELSDIDELENNSAKLAFSWMLEKAELLTKILRLEEC